MWFKTLSVYRISGPLLTMPPGDVEARLSMCPLQPCSALTWETRGFVAPVGSDDAAALVRAVGKHQLFALGVNSKLLPASVVKEELKKRCAEFQQAKGFAPGRKIQRDMKEAITTELLPTALTRRTVVRAWLDQENARIVFDTGSAGRCEEFLAALRLTLDCMLTPEHLGALRPMQANTPAATTFHTWLTHNRAPAPLHIESDVVLQSRDAGKATVRFTNMDVDHMATTRYLAEGMQPIKLGLVWAHKISFTLDSSVTLRRVRYIGVEPDGETTEADAFDADFTLMTGTLAPVINDVAAALNLPACGGDADDSNAPLSTTREPSPPPANDDTEQDPLYPQALAIVMETRKATISWLQRRLTIGYNRAARLVERMEVEGFVGPIGVGGGRKILKEGGVAAAS